MKHVIALLLLAACLQSHGDLQKLGNSDCYQCHRPDYENTPNLAKLDNAVPDHIANQALYTTQCATCHVTSTWASHPEASFAIRTGAHANIACTTCHDNANDNTSDAKGANTMCATCHPSGEMVYDDTLANEHQMLPMFSYAAPPAGFTKQNFCLSCHPAGTSKHHDDTMFPQSHHAQSCGSCHERAMGPDSASTAPCTRCHANAHNQSQGDPQGCLQQGCHYGGRGGD